MAIEGRTVVAGRGMIMHLLQQARRGLARPAYVAVPRATGETLELQEGSFDSTGGNGAVLLHLDGDGPSGWVGIDFAIVGDRPALADPVLVVESSGARPAEFVRLPAPAKGRVRAVVQLPAGYRRLLLRPAREGGRFTIGPIVLRPLSGPEGALRALLSVAGGMVAEPRRFPRAVAKAAQVFRQGGLRLLRQRLAERGHSVDRPDYSSWIAHVEPSGAEGRATIEETIAALPRKPLFSFLMVVHGTPAAPLLRTIGSVRAQLYSGWELCVASGAPPTPEVRGLIEEAQRQDERIRLVASPREENVLAAWNSALASARGDYLALLDPGAEPSEHSLALMAAEIVAHPESDLLYSDEDAIDDDGHRHHPYFKADFNQELLWSQDFIGQSGVYRRDLVVGIGGFRQGFEGCQAYDLTLRVLAGSAASRIRHVPSVLHHVGAAGSSGSPATSLDVAAAAQRALREHLALFEPRAMVEPGRFAGTRRVRWPLPEPAPLVSIIVPTRDAAPVLARCIDGVREKTSYPNYELLIVDNGSRQPDAVALLTRLGSSAQTRVLRYDRPFNFSAINNFAAREARGEVLVLLNDDTEVIGREWLSELVSHAVRPGIGAVGARLLYPDGRVQHAGVVTGILGVAGHVFKGLPGDAQGYFCLPHLLREVSAVTGACLAVRKLVYEEVGGLDERELQVAFNDIDFCLKLRDAGYRNLYTPWAELYHHESYSRGSDEQGRRLRRFRREIDVMRRRWPHLEHDPAYNPNLSLETDSYDLATAPRSGRAAPR